MEIMNQPEERNDRGTDMEAEAEKKIKRAINKLLDTMRPLPGRMSEVLEQNPGRRVGAADDPQLRRLEYLQAELSRMVESLHQLQASELGPEYISNDDFMKWLHALSLVPPSFNEYFDRSDQAAQFGCHAQLHRAVANCVRHTAGLPLQFLHGVDAIEEELSQLTEGPFTYRRLPLVEDGNTSAQPHIDESHLVGIEDALRTKVVRRFMDDGDGNKNLRVISIVGPAGVGKTTLAQVIYSKLHETGHCAAAARVVVSPRPDRGELLRNILSQIGLPEITTSVDEQQLVLDIRTHLKDRRYVILIDDMWKESDWDVLKYAFPQNNTGSRLIVSSRLQSVAELCCLIDGYRLGDVHEVKPLCEKDSEILFLCRLFDCEISCPNHTRSLAVSGTVDHVALDRFTCLMVLDLEGWLSFGEENSWLSICKMYLLRYLSLRKTGVTLVPPSIKELCKLETLDLSYTRITELPSQLCELSALKTFDLRGTPVTQLPEGIRKMRLLRQLLLSGNGADADHLDARATKAPVEIGNLIDLDTLELDLSECSDSLIEALGRIRNLRVVAITLSLRQSMDTNFLEQLCSLIHKWEELESLTIYCVLGCSMEVLESDLLSLSVRLKVFKVRRGRFFILPSWLGKLDRLVILEISVYKLMPGDLITLGNLGMLESLVLGLQFLPEEVIVIVGESLFPRIQKLSIRCRVPWMTFREGAMPKLSYLELSIAGSTSCQESVPSGISNLWSLTEVEIRYDRCYIDSPSVKATVEAVRKEVTEHHKTINLFINGTIQL